MKVRRTFLWILLPFFALGAFAFVATSRAGYETARYEVLEKHGRVEIRRYEAHVVVSTAMKDGAQNGSFGRLFQYISGNNRSESKVEMTTPVFMPASGDGEPREMQFVVPADVASVGAPLPKDPSVRLSKMKGGRYAVLRYSGIATGKARRAKLEELRAKLGELGLETTGQPIHAGYDPPWTPGPMRRNEVLLRVK